MKGDSNWVAGQYETDAEILLTGSEPIKGQDILAMWGGVGRSNERNWSFTTTDLQGDDNFLVETGTYDIKDIDKKPVDRGKYLIVWRKQADGSWKIYRELWRDISAIATDSKFDIHFRIVDAVSMTVVLNSDCYQYVVR